MFEHITGPKKKKHNNFNCCNKKNSNYFLIPKIKNKTKQNKTKPSFPYLKKKIALFYFPHLYSKLGSSGASKLSNIFFLLRPPQPVIIPLGRRAEDCFALFLLDLLISLKETLKVKQLSNSIDASINLRF